MICKGTIEERIPELQDKKKILSEKILEKDMDDSKYIGQLNEEDIKNLIIFTNEEKIFVSNSFSMKKDDVTST